MARHIDLQAAFLDQQRKNKPGHASSNWDHRESDHRGLALSQRSHDCWQVLRHN